MVRLAFRSHQEVIEEGSFEGNEEALRTTRRKPRSLAMAGNWFDIID